jgi:hypothetical protein
MTPQAQQMEQQQQQQQQAEGANVHCLQEAVAATGTYRRHGVADSGTTRRLMLHLLAGASGTTPQQQQQQQVAETEICRRHAGPGTICRLMQLHHGVAGSDTTRQNRQQQ